MSIQRIQTFSSIKFSAISQVGKQGMQILTAIILARVLAPSDFGLLNMALIVVGFAMVFKDLGTSAALIQKREITEALCSSVFWLNLGFGLCTMLIILLCAPLAGLYYQEARVVPVLQALSLSFFIGGFGFVQQALLERSLSFSSLARLELLSALVGAIAGIAAALAGAGVWSLVIQTLLTTLISTALLWLSSSWRPSPRFSWSDVRSVGGFGFNLVGFNVFNYFARNADYLLIGRYLGAQELGFYTLAYRILLFPLQNISAVMGRAMYPVLSSLQDDNEKFISVYLKTIRSIAFISFPLMTVAFALAEPVVLLFFGEKWRPVILLIMVLAPVGLVQSIGTTVGMIYQAKGRTDLMFRWGLASGIFVIIAFVIGLKWGIIGIAIAYGIVTILLFYPSFSIPFRLVGLYVGDLLKSLAPTFLSSVVILVALVCGIWFFSFPDIWALVLFFALGSAGYLLVSWLINREQLQEIWYLVFVRPPSQK